MIRLCTLKLQVTDGMVYPQLHNKHKKPVLTIKMFGMVNKHLGGKTDPRNIFREMSGDCHYH